MNWVIMCLSLRGHFDELNTDITASSQNIADSTRTSHSHYRLCSININIVARCRHHRLKADSALAMKFHNTISPKRFGLIVLYAIIHLTLHSHYPTIGSCASI